MLTDSWQNYMPCLGQRGQKPYPVQRHTPVFTLQVWNDSRSNFPYFEMPWQINTIANRSFSHDVMAAIFIYKKMNQRPCLCTIPVGIELFSHVKTFFCSKQFAKLLTTWLKTIYITMKWHTSILRVWTDFKCFFKCFFSHYRRPRFVCLFVFSVEHASQLLHC